MYRNYEVRCNTTQAITADNYIFFRKLFLEHVTVTQTEAQSMT